MHTRSFKIKFFLFVAAFLFSPNYVKALTCNIRYGSCGEGEVCLFSMYGLSNSHVANCSYYPYKVCCDDLVSAELRTTCNADEGVVISMFKPENSHAAAGSYYNYKVCARFSDYPVECSVRTSCYANETCVVSLYNETNSHVATCDFYPYKICCGKLSDLYVNQSSIALNDTFPVIGDALLFNIAVWNIGDAVATNINVSCYDNGAYFDSYVIDSIPPGGVGYAYCEMVAACPTNHNVSVRVDPANLIKEYSEANNEAWLGVNFTEKLSITIDSLSEGQQFSRCSAIPLQSTVTASCNPPSNYQVYWYNSTMHLIGVGEDTYWCINGSDSLLGPETINASVEGAGYVNSSTTVNINIVNNPPNVGAIQYNVTPPEIHIGQGIEISCKVNDTHPYTCGGQQVACVEDEDNFFIGRVNISVKRPPPYSDWSNVSASYELGIFYRDYGTQAGYPLGYYTTVCSASDSDNGYAESVSRFLVYQNVTVSMFLNATRYWWNETAKLYGWIKEIDGDPVPSANVTVRIGNTIVNETQTDSNGYYEATFLTPPRVGVYVVVVNTTHPITEKEYGNATSLTVSPYYGGSEEEMRTARNVGCYEMPKLVQNPDGSIQMVIVKVCVWK